MKAGFWCLHLDRENYKCIVGGLFPRDLVQPEGKTRGGDTFLVTRHPVVFGEDRVNDALTK